jgi:LysM repeat protein
MKRILISMTSLLLIVMPYYVGAQDAAVEERLDKLNGYIQTLLAAQADQQKRISDLARDVANLQEQVSKPTGNYASQEDLQKLAQSLRDIDQKRIADNEKIVATLEALKKASIVPHAEKARSKSTPESADNSGTSGSEPGFYYVIQSGDTLSAICLAYRQKGIKVTPEQILKANPGVKATNLQVGQKIFIPKQ